VVFPGQGVEGGEISGRVKEIVDSYKGNGEVPYQLSVFAASVTLYERLEESGVTADVVAGHSLGEYGAAYAAGSLGIEDAVRLVAERDRLMVACSRKNPGGMTALVGAEPGEVEEVVGEELERGGVVVAANFNTPRQTVISGTKDAVDAAAGRLGGRKFELEVAGAFHSPLMMDASQTMDGLLAETEFSEPRIPMISGTDGSLLEGADEIRDALRSQMLSPVRWTAVVERLARLGVEEVVEAGDGGTLVRMLRDFKELGLTGRKASEAIS
jgi:[acyl-carrier-protein] S-malonyltransferase